MSNSVKHGRFADAGRIEIAIATTDDRWSIVCRDNGAAGAEATARAAGATGLGTRVIQSLAASLDASLEWCATGEGLEMKLSGPGDTVAA